MIVRTLSSSFASRFKDGLGLLLAIGLIGLTLFVSQMWSVGGWNAWGLWYIVASVLFLIFWFIGSSASDEPVSNTSTVGLIGRYTGSTLSLVGMYGSLSCMLGVSLSVMPASAVSVVLMASLAVALCALLAIWLVRLVSASFFEGKSGLGYTVAAVVIGWNAFRPEALMTLMDLHPRGGVSFLGGLLVGALSGCVAYYVVHQISSKHPLGTASLFSTIRTPLNVFGLGVRRNQQYADE